MEYKRAVFPTNRELVFVVPLFLLLLHALERRRKQILKKFNYIFQGPRGKRGKKGVKGEKGEQV